MLCKKPFFIGSMQCSCGQCLMCRINRRRVWALRILLESFKHGDSCFATLTYRDDCVPANLEKQDYQNWLKRLRQSIYPKKIRYFVAGEYGEITHRPHFHAALFGLGSGYAGGVDGKSGVVQKSWDKGFTHVGELNWDSAQYIAGYLTKKVLVEEHKVKEFSRMSLRPGLGESAMGDVARVLKTPSGIKFLHDTYDVPSVLRIGSRVLPLGRYLRGKLRERLGFISKDTPEQATRLRLMQRQDEEAQTRGLLKEQGCKTWQIGKILLDTRNQKIKNHESRFLIRDQKRSLR